MEHAEALERIEIAAAEPEGLDRLMAGDTPDAAAVAGHLAGCPSCADELVRIRRDGGGRARRSSAPSRTRRCASGRSPSCGPSVASEPARPWSPPSADAIAAQPAAAIAVLPLRR